MATLAQWVAGARLRTLPVAIAPVIIGSAAAYLLQGFKLERAILALIVSIFLQIGVNYANDYSDGIRGTDENRVGPFRLVGSRSVRPQQVRLAALLASAAAMVAGLALVVLSESWWLLLVGLACVLAAWGYTGGENPYGYLGLGDIFVFVFFGLIATLGTCFTQAGQVNWEAAVGGTSTGLLAMALLMVNNIRDIHTDIDTDKRTLAVRLGELASRRLFVLQLVIAVALPLLLFWRYPWVLLMLLLIPAILPPAWAVLSGHSGSTLVPVLKQVGLLTIGFAALYSTVLVLAASF